MPVLVSGDAQGARRTSWLGPITLTRVWRLLTGLALVRWSLLGPVQDEGLREGVRLAPPKAHRLNGVLWKGKGDFLRERILGSKNNFHRGFTGFLTILHGRPTLLPQPCGMALLLFKVSLPTWPTGTSLANGTTFKSGIQPCRLSF